MVNSDDAPLEKREECSGHPFTKYLTENPLVVLWTGVLSFGGLLFLFYFWSIQYLPNLDLSSATALLAATAITGFGITVLFAIMLVIPGWFHREILCDLNSSNLLDKEGESKRLIGYFILPMLIVALIFLDILQEWKWWGQIFVLAVVVIYFLLVLSEISLKKELGTSSGQSPTLALVFIPIINGLVFVATSGFVVLLFTAKLEQSRPKLDGAVWEVFFLMTLTVIFVNAIVAKSGIREWKLILVVASSCLIILLIATRQPTMIPAAAVRILKVGDFSANLILDQQGRQIVQQFIGVTASSVSPTNVGHMKSDTDVVDVFSSPGTCLVQSIKILSRVGNEYYLEIQLPQDSTSHNEAESGKIISGPRFIIPSPHILSWETIEVGKESPTEICPKVTRTHKLRPTEAKVDQCQKLVQTCPSTCCVSQAVSGSKSQ